MAFTATVALVSAETVTTAMVLAAAVEVGTAMSVVGLVTGSRDLMKVGGAMALVGGVGGMINGAMTASASTAASGAAGEVGAAPDMLPDAIDAGGGFNPATGMGDAVTANAASAGQGIISDAAGMAPGVDPTATMGAAPAETAPVAAGDAAAAPVDPNATAADAKFGSTPAGGGAVNTPATDITSPTAVQTPAGSTQATTSPAGTPTGSGGSLDPNVNPTDVRLAAGTQTAPIASSGFFGKMMGFVQDPRNKLMLEGGAKLVGGALQGAQGQSQFNDKLALEKARLAQTSYGSQVAQNKPRRGIIAGAKA